MKNTGERLLTNSFDKYSIEHLHRYGLAIELARNMSVLDIASGEGYGANLLCRTASRVVGVDISEEAVTHARSKYIHDGIATRLEFLQGAADAIPAENSTFDLVTSFETLEHHDKHDEMMREIKRVLRPSGTLFISTPAKENYSDLSNTINEYHVKELYSNEFSDLLHRHFRNVRLYQQETDYFGIIAPADGCATASRCFQGSFNDIQQSTQISRPMYNLALASDERPPELPVSFFEGRLVLEDLKSRHRTRIEAMEAQLEAYKREIANVYSSTSFRIGRILTYPLRLFFRNH